MTITLFLIPKVKPPKSTKVCEAVQTIPFAAVIFFLDDNNQKCKTIAKGK